MGATLRESLYRGSQAMTLFKNRLVAVCGTGALGANLAEGLARCGVDRLRLIDCDRVEEHNLSTQPFTRDEVGAYKAEVLGFNLYRGVGAEAESICRELNARNVEKLLRGAELIVDCFDNSVSRRLVAEHCRKAKLACLHAGTADGCAEVIWNENYRVPSDRGEDHCDYPLARNLVTMTASVTCETVLRYLIKKERGNWTITLGDLRVCELAN